MDGGKVHAYFGAAHAVALPIEAPPEKLGVSYPYVVTTPATRDGLRAVAAGVTVKLGDRFFELDADATIADLEDGLDESVVHLTGACAEATVRVASADLEREPEPDLGGDGSWVGRLFGGTGQIPPDTELTWSDGTPGGRTLGTEPLPELQDAAGKRKCWLPYGLAADVQLCVAAKDVVARSTGEGTIGLGNIGLIGRGSGSGAGHGLLARVRLGKAKVEGKLDPDIIRRRQGRPVEGRLAHRHEASRHLYRRHGREVELSPPRRRRHGRGHLPICARARHLMH